MEQNNSKKNHNLVYGIIIAILAILSIWLLIEKIQNANVIEKDTTTIVMEHDTITDLTASKALLQSELDTVTKSLDSLQSAHTALTAEMKTRIQEFNHEREKLRHLLKKEKITSEELRNASIQITQLKGDVSALEAEIARLKQENADLTNKNQQLTTEKDTLQSNLTATIKEKEEIQNIASTLSVRDMEIAPVHIRKNGKEIDVKVASRVDALKVSFTLNNNPLAPSGAKTLYVCVYNQEGKIVDSEGSLKLRDGSELAYTHSLQVQYEQGKLNYVSFLSKNQKHEKYKHGLYKVMVYDNGFKISSDSVELRKGFLGL